MDGDLRYQPDADQQALAVEFNDTIAALLPIERFRTARVETAETLAGLEAAGLFSLGAAEAHGGSGLGPVEEALIVVGVGRQLASPDVVATIGAFPAIAAVRGPAVPRVAAGYRGDRDILVDGAGADLVLLREAAGATVCEVAGAATVDSGSWLSTLGTAELGAVVCTLDADALSRLRLLDAAVLAGIADGALAMAVDYAGMRQQFGRPIGSFQAVKHQAANMAIAARCALDQVSFAAVALEQGREDAALMIESAVLVAGTAALGNAAKNIQIHGGMGFSDEADAHLYLKRAQIYVTLAGGLEAAAERVAAIEPMVGNRRAP